MRAKESGDGMTRPRPTTGIIDYQNVHLVGVETFLPQGIAPHHGLINPAQFARTIIERRNHTLLDRAPNEAPAELARVIAYRGLPSAEFDPDGNARNQRQKQHWEHDPLVTVVHRPLRYEVRDIAYSTSTTGASERTREGRKPREKGIDVLCACAVIQHARHLGGLVILASHDSDLEPAVDFARTSGGSKIEGIQWRGDNGRYGYRLRATQPGFWVTGLIRDDFTRSLDARRTEYES